jgi:hypothetical protein
MADKAEMIEVFTETSCGFLEEWLGRVWPEEIWHGAAAPFGD